MELLTEHRRVSGPIVYGFLRLVRVSPARQAALVTSLAEYCHSHELQLSGIFTDRYTGVAPTSAAFTGLLDVLALPNVYAVTAPAISHLGPKTVAAERGRRIEAVGSRLLLVRKPDAAHHSIFRSGHARDRHSGTARVLDTDS
jgi:hypothetical protein